MDGQTDGRADKQRQTAAGQQRQQHLQQQQVVVASLFEAARTFDTLAKGWELSISLK